MAEPGLPPVADLAGLESLCATPARWRAPVAELARKLGLPTAPLAFLGGGNLVVAAGPGHVLKLTPPIFRREVKAEAAALALLADVPGLPVPELVATGEWSGWHFVAMTRLAGESLAACRGRQSPAELASLAGEIGMALRCLHAQPPPATGPLASDWAAYLERESLACVERQRRHGVDPGLVADMPRFLRAAALAPPAATVLLHADLTAENVLVSDAGGRWRVSGLIDFGDAMRGDALFDLVTPALMIACGDARLLAALFDGYGLPRAERSPALRRRLAALALLHRFNDLRRYAGWSARAPRNMDELAASWFPTPP